MRNELIDLYKLACANPQDKDIVRAYQSAKDRIGPQIAIHEALDNDALRARHNALREAVAWERECEALWNDNTATTCDGAFEVEDNLDAARAEVDRLLAATDTKSEVKEE